jgi:methyl-accepting chemotaxis protein
MPTDSIIFLVFTGILAFAVLLQTLILLGFFIAAKVAQRKAMEEIAKLREDMQPLLTGAHHVMEAVEDMTPRVRAITVNVQTASQRLRDQVDHIDEMVGDVSGKTRRQVGRIDTMVTDTLDAVAHGTRVVQENVMSPLRQLGGWMAAARAATDVFFRGDRRGRRNGYGPRRGPGEDFN